MAYTIIILKQAQKEARTLPLRDRRRIAAGIDSLATDPFRGKQLHGDHAGAWAIRVWPHRIIYTIQKEIVTVTVVKVGHRKDVYR